MTAVKGSGMSAGVSTKAPAARAADAIDIGAMRAELDEKRNRLHAEMASDFIRDAQTLVFALRFDAETEAERDEWTDFAVELLNAAVRNLCDFGSGIRQYDDRDYGSPF
jgi:hypothetical protein